MLIDIYARSFMTASRQDCTPLRDMEPVRHLHFPKAGRFQRLMHKLLGLFRSPRRSRCIDLQRL